MTIPAESEASVCGTSRWRHRWAGVRAGSREKPGTPLGRRQHRPLRAASAKACGTTAGAAGGREVRAGREGPRRGEWEGGRGQAVNLLSAISNMLTCQTWRSEGHLSSYKNEGNRSGDDPEVRGGLDKSPKKKSDIPDAK